MRAFKKEKDSCIISESNPIFDSKISTATISIIYTNAEKTTIPHAVVSFKYNSFKGLGDFLGFTCKEFSDAATGKGIKLPAKTLQIMRELRVSSEHNNVNISTEAMHMMMSAPEDYLVYISFTSCFEVIT